MHAELHREREYEQPHLNPNSSGDTEARQSITRADQPVGGRLTHTGRNACITQRSTVICGILLNRTGVSVIERGGIPPEAGREVLMPELQSSEATRPRSIARKR